jgi:hypothetical protein
MNIFQDLQNPSVMTMKVKLAYLLIIATLLWATGAPTYLRSAKASVTNISDTLSDSDMGVAASHTIVFTNSTSTSGGTTITVTFDPGAGDAFTPAYTTATTSHYGLSGAIVVANAAACSATASEVYVTADYVGSEDTATFTVCPNDSVSGGVKTILIGTSTPLITNPNPGTPTSYVIRVAGTMESGTADTRVAIIDDVTVTASIDSTFTFTISAVNSGLTYNGTTTSITTTATTIPFGSLTPNTPKVAAQRLNVTTNASNGFTVTVNATSSTGGSLVSSGGDDIDFFLDGSRTGTPANWTAPSNTTGAENTFGHFGLATTDSDYSFGSDQWVGDFYATTTRAIFTHGVASDGVTNGVGSTTVLYAIQVGSLQEAGTDYTTTLTYVATPIF